MKYRVAVSALAFCSTMAFAGGPTFTGQCPATSEIRLQKGTVTVNGQPHEAYFYVAMTNHNGLKMFTSMRTERTSVAVSTFLGVVLDHFEGFNWISPVECQYQLQNGDKILLFSMDPVGEFEHLSPASGNWSGNICSGSQASDCQWKNHIAPPMN